MGFISDEITKRLHESFQPSYVLVRDDSEKHHGHAGHDPRGESHFYLEIVSESFDGKTRLERHRMIHDVLSDLLKTRIHALSFKALTLHEQDLKNTKNANI